MPEEFEIEKIEQIRRFGPIDRLTDRAATPLLLPFES